MVANFWKCALQVNPFSYSNKYRYKDHGLDETSYNNDLADAAVKNNIKVIGIADHANVDHVDALREVLQSRGIIVFPGFEISSSEGVHFVCLWAEDTPVSKLERLLGSLDFIDEEDTTARSRFSAVALIQKVVNDSDGFIYAAHASGDGGILKLHCREAWKDQNLHAVQIPCGMQDFKENSETNGYYQIIRGKIPEYARSFSIGIINARDVSVPDDLSNPVSSCLIKMTEPCFRSFKEAFCDPESRVRLNSDVLDIHYPYLDRVKFTGGYLDGIEIKFSQNLNAIIGGRGTGKSTLIECLRYVLEAQPFGREAARLNAEIVKANLGNERGTIEVSLRSSKPGGRKFTITKQYGGVPYVTDDTGAASSFQPAELMPGLKVLGQNEILEIARDPVATRRLVMNAMNTDGLEEETFNEIHTRLISNRNRLCKSLEKLASLEEDSSKLQKCQEDFSEFKKLGIDDKLKIVPDIERARSLLKQVDDDVVQNLDQAFENLRNAIPDLAFLSDKSLPKQIGIEFFPKIRSVLSELSEKILSLLKTWEEQRSSSIHKIDEYRENIRLQVVAEEKQLEKVIAKLKNYEGLSGRELGAAYQELVKKIARYKPAEQALLNAQKEIEALWQKRRSILKERAQNSAKIRADRTRALKRLNNRLDNRVKIEYDNSFDHSEVINYIVNCRLENIATAKRLDWICDANDFSAEKLADCLRREQHGEDGFAGTGWRITSLVRNSLSKMTEAQLLGLEEIDIRDKLIVKLNISGDNEPEFKPIDGLSTGQQCTAILHLLLLETNAPLIMDQPEDNLDNAFIAESIVRQLRAAKLSRQFIFATHNANIPVFGDAEWIGVMKVVEGRASMPSTSQGAIDFGSIKQDAADILEGGRAAFNQRKDKYGF